MTETTVEIIPGPNLPTEFTARIAQPSQPTPSPIPPVGLVEIETAAQLIAGPPGPIGPVGPPGPQGSPDTAAQVLAKLVTVDGSGSGLDADLLDGQDGAYYLAWANFTGKPATFPPTLPIAESDVTNLVSDLASKLNSSTAATTYAPIANPTFTGDPKAPTPVAGDNDTSIATTAFVTGGLSTKIGDAPSDGTQYVRQNAAWSPVSVPPGTFIGDNPPPSPAVGQLWWQSSTGALFLYYNDGNSTQWVQVNSTSPPPPRPVLAADDFSVVGQPAGAITLTTAIPSTATEIEVMIDNLKTGGTVQPEIRIGSGSLLASGYTGTGITVANTPTVTLTANSTGWKTVAGWTAAAIIRGFVTLRKRSSANIWMAQGTFERIDVATAYHLLMGQVSLGGVLDRVGIVTTDTWTTGTVAVWYR